MEWHRHVADMWRLSAHSLRVSCAKKVKWFIYYMVAVAARRVVLLLPRKTALNLGVLLADLLFLLLHRDKARALENLSIAFGEEKRPGDILRLCHYCFESLGKGLMEVLQFPRLTSQNLDRLVAFEGKQNIDSALKMGRGVIILTAHFGNWELLGASLALSGYGVSFIVRPVRSSQLDALVNRNRESMGIGCIPRGRSVRDALRCLKRNELLGILADIDTRVDGVFVDFFGRPAFTPRGPMSIALKTGAALVPAFIIRQSDDTHRVVIEKALKLRITGVLEEDIRVNTARFTKIIESYIRQYPEQWIWIHQRWKTRPSRVRDNRACSFDAR
jgi:KDO2-lipid IV(A) lauroyltransferase